MTSGRPTGGTGAVLQGPPGGRGLRAVHVARDDRVSVRAARRAARGEPATWAARLALAGRARRSGWRCWAAQAGGLLEEVRSAPRRSLLRRARCPGAAAQPGLRSRRGRCAGPRWWRSVPSALACVVGLRWRDVELAVVHQGMAAQQAALELLSRGGDEPRPGHARGAQHASVTGSARWRRSSRACLALLLFAGLCLAGAARAADRRRRRWRRLPAPVRRLPVQRPAGLAA